MNNVKNLNKKETKEANKAFINKSNEQMSKVLQTKDEVQQILLILNQRLDYARNTIHNIVISLERKKDVSLSRKTLDTLNDDINVIEKELVRIIKELDFKFGE